MLPREHNNNDLNTTSSRLLKLLAYICYREEVNNQRCKRPPILSIHLGRDKIISREEIARNFIFLFHYKV